MRIGIAFLAAVFMNLTSASAGDGPDWAACTGNPSISSISPNRGSTSGGISYAIQGKNFCAGLTVKFGSVSAPVSQVGSTLILGIVPANAAGVVNLVVTNPNGHSATLKKGFTYVASTPPLVASAGPAVSGNAGQSLVFSGSVSGGVAPYAYLWNFGDGTTDTTLKPSHAYGAAGVYSVSFTVRDSSGATAVSTTTATANAVSSPLVANAGPAVSGDVTDALVFSGSASGGVPPYTFSWNFGDGSSDSTQTPSHTYAADGTYSVTLSVTDSVGSVAASSTTATISTNYLLDDNGGYLLDDQGRRLIAK